MNAPQNCRARERKLKKRVVVLQQEVVAFKECQRTLDNGDAPFSVDIDTGLCGNVLDLSFEDGGRAFDRPTTMPELDDALIAGGCQRARPEIGAKKDGVVVFVGREGLGLRKMKTISDELFPRRIEFAHDNRVAAAAGQSNDAPRLRRRAFRSLPDPVLALVGSEFVDVEE